MDYKPIRRRHESTSEQTNKLLKRKRVLEFTTSAASEWLELAGEFQADGGRANHAYCMTQYRKHGGQVEEAEIEVPEPEFEYPDYTDV